MDCQQFVFGIAGLRGNLEVIHRIVFLWRDEYKAVDVNLSVHFVNVSASEVGPNLE